MLKRRDVETLLFVDLILVLSDSVTSPRKDDVGTPMATIAIGDIHGSLAALDDLLERVLPYLSSADHLVFLGDYIDRGPDVPGCVERIVRLQSEQRFEVVALLGNHEQMMMRTLQDPSSHSWIWNGGLDTIRSYSEEAAASILRGLQDAGSRLVTERVCLGYQEFFDQVPAAHMAFFTALQPYYETADVVCVHAGVDPRGTPIQLQDPDSLVWGPDGFPDRYQDQAAVVYGHWDNAILDESGWPWPNIQNNRTFGIDTISSGVLTAMRFPEGQVLQSHRPRSLGG